MFPEIVGWFFREDYELAFSRVYGKFIFCEISVGFYKFSLEHRCDIVDISICREDSYVISIDIGSNVLVIRNW